MRLSISQPEAVVFSVHDLIYQPFESFEINICIAVEVEAPIRRQILVGNKKGFAESGIAESIVCPEPMPYAPTAKHPFCQIGHTQAYDIYLLGYGLPRFVVINIVVARKQ